MQQWLLFKIRTVIEYGNRYDIQILRGIFVHTDFNSMHKVLNI